MPVNVRASNLRGLLDLYVDVCHAKLKRVGRRAKITSRDYPKLSDDKKSGVNRYERCSLISMRSMRKGQEGDRCDRFR